MQPTARIAALARLADLALASGDAELVAIGGDLEQWLRDGDGGLEQALGVAGGGQSWRFARALDQRDEALRQAARRFNLGAGELELALARYAAAGWRRDRTAQACPPHLAGNVREYLWRALKARDRVLRKRQIQDIIGNSQGDQIAETLCHLEPRKDVTNA